MYARVGPRAVRRRLQLPVAQLARALLAAAHCVGLGAEGAPRAEANRVKRAKESGAWLTAVPSHKNGTTLSKEEFSDNLRYRNGFEPLNIPQFCDGCGAEFTTEKGLNCKVGGLVHERHDTTADTWIYLGAQAFQPSTCSHKPMVNEGNPRGHGDGGA